MVWKRPDSVPFPNVWSRFKGRRPMADGKIPSFRIQDIPDDMRERAVDFMCENFLREEPISESLHAAASKDAENDLRNLWNEALVHKLAVICLVEDEDGNLPENPVIAGLNMTTLSSKNDKSEFVGSPVATQIMNPILFVTEQANVYEKFGVNDYMTAYGLSVNMKFRGQNLGYEILKVREPICRAVGLKLTGTVFTATVSQVLAKRCGFEDVYEISYKDLAEKHNMDVNKKTESIKYMVLVVS